jgi:hypothetical protein
MQVIGTTHAFDREDTPAGDLAHRRQARANGLSIQQNRAGTTFPFTVTTLFGPGQAQFVPQHI